MKIEPENIQVGDRVTVSGTVQATSLYGRRAVNVKLDGSVGYFTFSPEELAHAEITRPPKPLAVGDRVVCSNDEEPWCVLFLHGDRAWLTRKSGDKRLSDHHALVNTLYLTRIEETADEAG